MRSSPVFTRKQTASRFEIGCHVTQHRRKQPLIFAMICRQNQPVTEDQQSRRIAPICLCRSGSGVKTGIQEIGSIKARSVPIRARNFFNEWVDQRKIENEGGHVWEFAQQFHLCEKSAANPNHSKDR
jgi:hypothetical protein